jgi:hypothetical protein
VRRKKPRPVLPPPCAVCRPTGGYWRIGFMGGLERCDCPRGVALSQMRRNRGRLPAAKAEAFDGRMAQTGE